MLEVLAAEYHWTLHYCMFKLKLPDIFNYLAARNHRIKIQNGDTAVEEEINHEPTEEELIRMFAGGNFGVSQG